MNYEEYKGKLQMLLEALDELRSFRQKQYENAERYIRSVRTTDEKIDEQLKFIQKKHIEDEENYTEQVEFVRKLEEKIIYSEITTDVLERMQASFGKENAENSAAIKCVQMDNTAINKDNAAQQKASSSEAEIPKKKQQTDENKDDAIYANFIKAYNEGTLKKDSECLKWLKVCDEFSSKLVCMNYTGWQDYPDKDKVNLIDAQGQPQYFAYDAADYIAEVKQREKYYLLTLRRPFAFNEQQIINNATLSFFDLPGYGADCVNGIKPKLVRPAVLKKEQNGKYSLATDNKGNRCKGEYRL